MARAATREATNARLLERGDFEQALFSMNLAGQRGIRTLIAPDTHGSPEQRVLSFRHGHALGEIGSPLILRGIVEATKKCQ